MSRRPASSRLPERSRVAEVAAVAPVLLQRPHIRDAPPSPGGTHRQESGVWVGRHPTDRCPAAPDPRMCASPRDHPAIIAEGFLAHVETVAAGPLFPRVNTDSATTKFGRWIRGTVGMTDPRLGPSHSFRHRMEDELRRVTDARDEHIDALTGRHNPRNAGAGYGRGLPPANAGGSPQGVVSGSIASRRVCGWRGDEPEPPTPSPSP